MKLMKIHNVGVPIAVLLLIVLLALGEFYPRFQSQAQVSVGPSNQPVFLTTAGFTSTASSQTIIPGSVGQRIWVGNLVVGNASQSVITVSIIEGTGGVCAVGITSLIGGTTAANGIPILASTDLLNISPNGFTTNTAGNDVCLWQSGSGRVAGGVAYRYIPAS